METVLVATLACGVGKSPPGIVCLCLEVSGGVPELWLSPFPSTFLFSFVVHFPFLNL